MTTKKTAAATAPKPALKYVSNTSGKVHHFHDGQNYTVHRDPVELPAAVAGWFLDRNLIRPA